MILLLQAALVLQAPALGDPARSRHQAEDFDQAYAFLRERYAWPERVDWRALRDAHRPRAIQASGDRAFHAAMETFLAAFGDAHTHLGSNLADSWRLPPGDIAAEWRGKDVVVVAVKPGSAAEAAGLRAGQGILAWEGSEDLGGLSARRLSSGGLWGDPEIRHWALNALLAGQRGQERRLQVRGRDGSTRTLVLPSTEDQDPPLPDTRLLPGGIGYIAFRNFGAEAEVARMDKALARFPRARGWILDLRLNYGGDTAFMKPILGRFLRKRTRFALMRKRAGEGLGAPWEEWVEPRGRAFTGPLAVLVSPWTMSVAESLAMAVQTTGRGTAVGARTAGLGAAVHSLTLRHSELRVQISTEPVYDPQGRPREAFRPAVAVDLAVPPVPGGGDPTLEAALAWIRARQVEASGPR